MTTEELSSREYQFNCPQKIVAGSRFHHTTHRLSFEASFIVPANDSCVTQDNFGFWGATARICRAWIPFSLGRPTSRSINCGLSVWKCRTASAPSATWPEICNSVLFRVLNAQIAETVRNHRPQGTELMARALEGDLHHFNSRTTHSRKFTDVLSRIQIPQLGEGRIDSI